MKQNENEYCANNSYFLYFKLRLHVIGLSKFWHIWFTSKISFSFGSMKSLQWNSKIIRFTCLKLRKILGKLQLDQWLSLLAKQNFKTNTILTLRCQIESCNVNKFHEWRDVSFINLSALQRVCFVTWKFSNFFEGAIGKWIRPFKIAWLEVVSA